MDIYSELKSKAAKKFNRNASEFESFFSPGRVNLIGEHVDYNGGLVLPCPLDFGTMGVAVKNTDEIVRCYSENFDEVGVIEFAIDEIKKDPKENWVGFVKGIILEMVEDGFVFNNGFDLYIKGSIPNGAGLSSSASLELLIGIMLRDFYYLDYSNLDLVLIGQRCEHHYIGVNCGIMDQFVIGMGQDKKAILLNTNNLKYDYCDCDFGKYQIVIGNTNYRRTLADSKYNERRSECEEGLQILKQYADISCLCDLSVEQFELLKDKIPSEVIRKRVKHVVYENNRTKVAFQALQNRDFVKFGQLLNQSHKSLKEDYEVTGLALDSLVSAFQDEDILGARMTGAGFGGCMIALVEKDKTANILPRVNEKYFELCGLKADFYIANVGSGACKID